MAEGQDRPRRLRMLALSAGLMLIGCAATALAQQPPQGPPPAPPTPPAVGAPGSGTSEQLLKEMQQLREQVKELATLKEQMAQLKKSQDEKIKELEKKLEEQKNQSKEQLWKKTANFEDEPPWAMGRPSYTPGGNPAIAAPASDAANIAGAGARDNVPVLDDMVKRPGPAKRPTKSFFGPGFEWSTDDGEFLLQIHNETQADYRFFLDESRSSVPGLPRFPDSGIYIPRERIFLMGRITKPIEYYVSTNAFFGGFNLLDAFLNFRYDNRLMFKFGRFKPPFPYEFFGISNQDLIAPERSLFAINFGGGRQLAGMLWGELFARRLDYAVALTDGLRNSYGDFNSGKDVAAFFNYKPFLQTEGLDFLRHLNVGGAVMAGQEDNPLVPFGLFTASTFPTGRSTPGVLNASPAFLLFNEGVRERGPRALWSLHLSYFYRGLSLLGGWNSGYESYGLESNTQHTKVPINAYFIQAAYLLTGESITARSQIKPLCPFDLRKGKFGLGAWEVHGRYSYLNVGDNVFTDGYANPDLWSNQAYAIDTGVNWYLNQFVKVYFDWQHAVFGNPVYYGGNGLLHKTSNMLWMRLQLYF